MFSVHAGLVTLVHPKCFQLCLRLVIWGGGGGEVDGIYVVCI